jgi:hypothetical protein
LWPGGKWGKHKKYKKYPVKCWHCNEWYWYGGEAGCATESCDNHKKPNQEERGQGQLQQAAAVQSAADSMSSSHAGAAWPPVPPPEGVWRQFVALQQAGATSITITNRSAEKAKQLADEFNLAALPWDVRHEMLAEASLLVNTTSLGMEHQPPLDLSLAQLPAEAVVHDIVYAPLETPLLNAAHARGHHTVDGLGMLLYQAQQAFFLWHGVMPKVTDALRAHVLEHSNDPL